LRPFSAVKEQTSTEELMIQIFEHRGILICVDEPGFQYGMGRLILSAGEWQIAVRLLCERAAVIVMYPGASAGVLWELGEIFNCGWLDRTLFFMPPNPISIFGPAFRPTFKQLMQNNPRVGSAKAAARFNEIDIGGNWEEARARAREIGVILPAYCDDGGMFRIRSGRLEWLTVFARNLFFGKSPKRSLEALGPIIDAYVSNTNSVPALR
jgi:hypothetical protein